MLAVTIVDQQKAELVEQPNPRPYENWVVVRVTAVPMCTEYKAYREGIRSDRLGHEAVGVVEAVAQPCRVRVGDRVVVMPQYPCGACALCVSGDYIHCENTIDLRDTGNTSGAATYAQFLLKPDWLLVPIPDDMSDDHAGMACCGLGPTFGAMERIRVDAFDTVCITGMGPVGLGGVINARRRNARVFAVESQPYRAELARSLGADAVVDPGDPEAVASMRAMTGGRGVDAGIECSGSPAARRMLIELVRRRGRVAMVGEGGDLHLDVSRDLLRKGIELHGSWHYNRRDCDRVMQAIASVRPQLDQLITHRYPMTRVEDAFELQLTGNCGKVVLDPWA